MNSYLSTKTSFRINPKFSIELLLLKTYFFLLPFEFIVTMGASGLFKGLVGEYYFLAQPSFLLPLILFACQCGRSKNVRLGGFLSSILSIFCLVGILDVIASMFAGEYVLLSIQQFLFGFFIPIVMLVSVLRYDCFKRSQIFAVFYQGYIIFFGLALLVLFFDGVFADLHRQVGLGAALVSFRYQYADSLFHLILGNFNKQSNFVLLVIFFGPWLLMAGSSISERHLKLYNRFFWFGIFYLLIMFSRAALLMLPFIVFVNRAYIGFVNRRNMLLFLMVFLVSILLLFDVYALAINYLLFSEYIDGTSAGFAGSFNQRFIQWATLYKILSDQGAFLSGLGVGGYGVMLGGTVSSGTHNLFLDHLMSSGVISFLCLILIVLLGLLQSAYRSRMSLFLLLPVFIGLSVREYSFSYQYVTSLGGILFLLMFYLLVSSDRKSSRQKNSPLIGSADIS